jgi:hypothetical protein
MKKIYLTLIIMAPLLLGGCTSTMDAPNDGRVSGYTDVFSQQQRVQNFINDSFYAAPFIVYNSFGFNNLMLASFCDEAEEANISSSSAEQWYDGKATSYNIPVEGSVGWDRLFGTVYKCNVAIKYLTDPNLNIDYDINERQAFLAQAYAFRSFLYLELMKRYGQLPILTRPVPSNYDYSKDYRASVAEVADFIINTCDSALNSTSNAGNSTVGFEWKVSSTGDGKGKYFSRAAVWFIKSQAALIAASPLWQNDYAGTEQYTWDRAAVITKAALDQCTSHGYALFNASTRFPVKGVNSYDSYFLSAPSYGGGWDSETIYSPFDGSCIKSNVAFAAGLPITSGQWSAGACPTQELVDSYEVLSKDGLKSAPVLDLANPYKSDGTPNITSEAKAYGYSEAGSSMYENRDPRFYATIFYNNSECGVKGPVETYEGGNCGIVTSTSTNRYTRTGYYLRKFQNPESSADGNYEGYARTYRLAQLYLNFAEAAFRSSYGADGKVPATPGSGSTVSMSSREALNAIRERAGMPSIHETGEAYWLRYVNERRVELAFEEQRYYDVRRWQIPTGDLTETDQYVSGMDIVKNSDGSFTYKRFRFAPRECHSNKYLFNPIELSEVQRMQKLTGKNWQNPGWEL